MGPRAGSRSIARELAEPLEAALLGAEVAAAALALATATRRATALATATEAATTTAEAAAELAAAAAPIGTWAAETTGAAATDAGRPILGHVHLERSPAELFAIEEADRRFGFALGSELDEREAAGPASGAVVRQKHIHHRPGLGHQGAQVVFGGAEGQVADEDFLRNGALFSR